MVVSRGIFLIFSVDLAFRCGPISCLSSFIILSPILKVWYVQYQNTYFLDDFTYVLTGIFCQDIFGNYPFFFFIAVVLPLVFSILTVSMANVIVPTDDEYKCGSGSAYYIFSDIYYWGRVASIGLNLVVFAIISVKLRKMAINEGAGSNHSAAIFALVRRMKYYPIAQLLTRRFLSYS